MQKYTKMAELGSLTEIIPYLYFRMADIYFGEEPAKSPALECIKLSK